MAEDTAEWLIWAPSATPAFGELLAPIRRYARFCVFGGGLLVALRHC